MAYNSARPGSFLRSALSPGGQDEQQDLRGTTALNPLPKLSDPNARPGQRIPEVHFPTPRDQWGTYPPEPTPVATPEEPLPELQEEQRSIISELSDSFIYSVMESNPEMVEGTFRVLGHETGVDAMFAAADWIKEIREQEESGRPPSVHSVEEIEGIGDLARWGLGAIGQVAGSYLPVIGGMAAGAGVGAGLSALAGPAAPAVAAAAVPAGATSGAYMASTSLVTGEAFLHIKDELVDIGISEEEAEKRAAKGAMRLAPVLGALDAVPVLGAAKSVSGKALGKVKGRLYQDMATALARGSLQGAVAEGLTEGAQNALMEAYAAVETGRSNDEERAMRTLNAILVGGVGGGALRGGAESGAVPINRQRRANRLEKIRKYREALGEIRKARKDGTGETSPSTPPVDESTEAQPSVVADQEAPPPERAVDPEAEPGTPGGPASPDDDASPLPNADVLRARDEMASVELGFPYAQGDRIRVYDQDGDPSEVTVEGIDIQGYSEEEVGGAPDGTAAVTVRNTETGEESILFHSAGGISDFDQAELIESVVDRNKAGEEAEKDAGKNKAEAEKQRTRLQQEFLRHGEEAGDTTIFDQAMAELSAEGVDAATAKSIVDIAVERIKQDEKRRGDTESDWKTAEEQIERLRQERIAQPENAEFFDAAIGEITNEINTRLAEDPDATVGDLAKVRVDRTLVAAKTLNQQRQQEGQETERQGQEDESKKKQEAQDTLDLERQETARDELVALVGEEEANRNVTEANEGRSPADALAILQERLTRARARAKREEESAPEETATEEDSRTPTEESGRQPEEADTDVRQADTSTPEEIEVEEAATNVEPSDGQKEAGNYQKGHVKVQGLDISIENPKGSVRRGVSATGEEWESELPATYGYIRRTEGADGDQVDVYLGETPDASNVFVVNQVDPETGKFDEHKVFVGFKNRGAVRKTYDAAFSDGSGPARRGNTASKIRVMSMDQFKGWLADGDQTKSLTPKQIKQIQEKLDQGEAAPEAEAVEEQAETAPEEVVDETPAEEVEAEAAEEEATPEPPKAKATKDAPAEPDSIDTLHTVAEEVGGQSTGVLIRRMWDRYAEAYGENAESEFNEVVTATLSEQGHDSIDDVFSAEDRQFFSELRAALTSRLEQEPATEQAPAETTEEAPVEAAEAKPDNRVKSIVRRSITKKNVSEGFKASVGEETAPEQIEEEIAMAFMGGIQEELEQKGIEYDEGALLSDIKARVNSLKPDGDPSSSAPTQPTKTKRGKKKSDVPATEEAKLEKFRADEEALDDYFKKKSGTLHSGLDPEGVRLLSKYLASAIDYQLYRGVRKAKEIAHLMIEKFGVERFKSHMQRPFRVVFSQIRTRYDNEPWANEITHVYDVTQEVQEAVEEAEAAQTAQEEAGATETPPEAAQAEPTAHEGASPSRISGRGRQTIWGVQLPVDAQAKKGDVAHVVTRRGKEWWTILGEKATTRSAIRGEGGQVDVFSTGARRYLTEKDAKNASRAIHGTPDAGERPVEGEVGARPDETPVDDGGAASVDEGSPGPGEVSPGEESASEDAEYGDGAGSGGVRGSDSGQRPGGRSTGEDEAGPSVSPDEVGGVEAAATSGSIRPAVSGPRNAGDFSYTADEAQALISRGPKQRALDNVAAIRLAKQLTAEGRRATREEQAVLAKYVSWGGLKNVVYPDTRKQPWQKEVGAELDALLNEDEMAGVRTSILNAHYTPPHVVTAMWDAVKAIGFTGGKVLEPAVGSGVFLGLRPPDMRTGTQWTINERDPVTAEIAGHLYPSATTLNKSFEDIRLSEIEGQDLVITNVPFSDTAPVEASQEVQGGRGRGPKLNLHDYFIVKSIRALRPGGIAAVITSSGTMDKVGKGPRSEMMKHGDFLGAVRLHSEAAKAGAGADVVMDVLFFQRRVDDVAPYSESLNNEFVELAEVQLPTDEAVKEAQDVAWDALPKTEAGSIAQYFARNLEVNGGSLIWGRPAVTTNTRYGQKSEVTVVSYDGMGGVEQPIRQLADQLAGVMSPYDAELSPTEPQQVDTPPPPPLETKKNLSKKEAKTVEQFQTLHAALSAFNAMGEESNREERRAAHDALVQAYSAIVSDGQSLRKHAHDTGLLASSMFETLQGLEYEDSNQKRRVRFQNRVMRPIEMLSPAWLEAQDLAAERDAEARKTESDTEKLWRVVSVHGRADADALKKSMGKTLPEVIESLGDLVYQDPDNPDQLVLSAMYLSGDVRTALEKAEEKADEDPSFNRNVEALKKALPPDRAAERIVYKVSAPWVGDDVIEDFATHLLGDNARRVKAHRVDSGRYEGEFRIDGPGMYGNPITITRWGTPEKPMKELLESLRNGGLPAVWRETVDDRRVLDATETARATAKYHEIAAEFQKWVLADSERSQMLSANYNRHSNRYVVRNYDAVGQHLTFPRSKSGAVMTELWRERLRVAQRGAIARAIMEQSTYFAHEVGAGKTAEMIGAAMEWKRLGLVKAPLFVLPKKVTGSFQSHFLQMYGGTAKVLFIDGTLDEKRRQYARLKAGEEFDAILVTKDTLQNNFKMSETAREKALEDGSIIDGAVSDAEFQAMSPAQREKYLEARRKRLKEEMKSLSDEKYAKGGKGGGRSGKNLEKLRDDADRTRIIENFEDTPFDALLVDEAHEKYKNLGISSKYLTRGQKLAGIDNVSSQSAKNLYAAAAYLRNINGKMVMASGTPITNSITEIFTILRYLVPHEQLVRMGISTFDGWLGQYGKIGSLQEYDTTGTIRKSLETVQALVNLDSLLTIMFQYMDVKTTEDAGAETPGIEGNDIFNEDNIVNVEPTESQLEIQADALDRRAQVPPRPQEGDDTHLSILNDLLSASISPGMVGYENDDGGKLPAIADEVTKIYEESSPINGVQLVFLDRNNQTIGTHIGVPTSKRRGQGFNSFARLKQLLVEKGIPEDEIQRVGSNEEKNDRLFEDARAGRVRVVFASTQQGGTGVNMQTRMVAIHNGDIGWNAAGIFQRIGRGNRPGNEVKNLWTEAGEERDGRVRVRFYATNSFTDGFNIKKVARKYRQLIAVLRGQIIDTLEETNEQADATEQLDRLAAIATGNPNMIRIEELESQIGKLNAERENYALDKAHAEASVRRALDNIAFEERRVEAIGDAITLVDRLLERGTIQYTDSDTVFDLNTEDKDERDAMVKAQAAAMTAAVTDTRGGKDRVGTIMLDDKAYALRLVPAGVTATGHNGAYKDNRISMQGAFNEHGDFFPFKQLIAQSIRGLKKSKEGRLEKAGERLSAAQSNHESAVKNAEEYRDSVWQGEADLADAMDELDELEGRTQEESATDLRNISPDAFRLRSPTMADLEIENRIDRELTWFDPDEGDVLDLAKLMREYPTQYNRARLEAEESLRDAQAMDDQVGIAAAERRLEAFELLDDKKYVAEVLDIDESELERDDGTREKRDGGRKLTRRRFVQIVAGALGSTVMPSLSADEVSKLSTAQAEEIMKALRVLGKEVFGTDLQVHRMWPAFADAFATTGIHARNPENTKQSEVVIDIERGMDEAIDTLAHEGYHFIHTLDVLTQEEMALLEKKARDEWVEKYGVRDLYGESLHVEEAIAFAFGDWMKQRYREVLAGDASTPTSTGTVGKIMEKMHQFLMGLRGIVARVLKGRNSSTRGWLQKLMGKELTAETIFASIAGGYMAGRNAGAKGGKTRWSVRARLKMLFSTLPADAPIDGHNATQIYMWLYNMSSFKYEGVNADVGTWVNEVLDSAKAQNLSKVATAQNVISKFMKDFYYDGAPYHADLKAYLNRNQAKLQRGPAAARPGQTARARDTRIKIAKNLTENQERVRDDLQRVGRESFGGGFQVQLAEKIGEDLDESLGAYSPMNRTIYIALRASEEGMRSSLWHEGLHHLRAMGAFEREDGSPTAAWEILERQAKKSWRKKYNIDARYQGEAAGMSEAALEDLMNEEAVAEALAEYQARGKKAGLGPSIRASLNRILRFFRALANAMRGMGFQTWEDVFESDIESGAAGRRADVQQALREDLDSGLQAQPVFQRERQPPPKLRATHSLSVDHLRRALNVGMFTAPSIAITPEGTPHKWISDFNVDVIFKAGTLERRDRLVSGDAWTQTHPGTSTIIRSAKQREALAQAVFNDLTEMPEALRQAVRDATYSDIDLEKTRTIHSELFEPSSGVPPLNVEKHAGLAMLSAIYLAEKGRKRLHGDRYRLREAIEKEQDAFEAWRDEYIAKYADVERVMFDGFTDLGSKRWKRATPDNILSKMKAAARFGDSLSMIGASFSELVAKARGGTTISQVRKQADKIDPEAYGGWGGDEFTSLDNEFVEKMGALADQLQKEGFKDRVDFFEALTKTIYRHGYGERTRQALKEFDIDIPLNELSGLREIVEKAKELPVKYFEAKPMRHISVDDIAVAVVPEGFPTELAKRMRGRGIRVRRKRKGMTDAELAALQDVPDALFQRPEATAPEANEPRAQAQAQQRRWSTGSKVNLTPEQIKKTKAHLEHVAKLMFGDKVELRESQGTPEIVGNVIRMAFGRSDAIATVGHEGIHWLRSIGAFTEAEWDAFVKQAKAKWMKEYGVAEKYSELSEEEQTEEAIAEAFGRWLQSRAEPGVRGMVTRAFASMRRFLRNIRRWLKGQAWFNYEDVFESIARGEIETAAAGQSAESLRQLRLAAKGLKGDAQGIVKDISDTMEYIIHSFTRYHRYLPKTEWFADAHEDLRLRRAAMDAATSHIARYIRGMVKDLTPKQYKLLSQKVMVDNLIWQQSEEMGVPFDALPGDLQKLAKKVEEDLAKPENAVIHERLALRDEMKAGILKQLIEHGVLDERSARNPHYAYNQVLMYATQKSVGGGGGPIHKRGWQRRRGGESLINADFIEPETEWMHQALVKIATNHLVMNKVKDSKYDITGKIRALRRAHNKANTEEALAAAERREGGTMPQSSKEWVGYKPRSIELKIWREFTARMAYGFNMFESGIADIQREEVPEWLRDDYDNILRTRESAEARQAVQRAAISTRKAAEKALGVYDKALEALAKQEEKLSNQDTPSNQDAVTKAQKKVQDAKSALLDAQEAADSAAEKVQAQQPVDTKSDNYFALVSWVLHQDENAASGGARMLLSTMQRRTAFQSELLGKKYIPVGLRQALSKLQEAGETGLDGHVLWQPEAGYMLHVNRTVPEEVMSHFMRLQSVMEEDTEKQLKDVVSKEGLESAIELLREFENQGGPVPRPYIVIPEEIAKTLDETTVVPDDGHFVKNAFRMATSAWKTWVLLNPLSLIRFHTLNLSGDIDIALGSMPGMLTKKEWFKRIGQAMRVLVDVEWHRREDREGVDYSVYDRALERGIITSNWTSAEIPEAARTQFMKEMSAAGVGERENAVKKYWRRIKIGSNIRENILRLALFMELESRGLKAIDENLDPLTYTGLGAARRELVTGLTGETKEDELARKAAVVVRETIGDYQRLSTAGSWFRSFLVPFFSFMEINMRRYFNLFRNVFTASPEMRQSSLTRWEDTGRLAGLVTKRIAMYTSVTTAALFLRTHLYLGVLTIADKMMRNLTGCPDSNDGGAIVRDGLTIMCSPKKNYHVQIRSQGALADIMSWVGFPDIQATISAARTGHTTWGDVASVAAEAFVAKGVNSISPFLKTPIEALTGLTFWPNAMAPRPIREPLRHTLKSGRLEWIYDMFTEKPQRLTIWQMYGAGAIFDVRDTGETAYFETRSLAYRWAENVLGREQVSMLKFGESSNLMHYYKIALRKGDKELAKKFHDKLREHVRQRQKEGIRTSLSQLKRTAKENSHPLKPIKKSMRGRFRASLPPEEKDRLKRAEAYWQKLWR